jgi:hypothetical protein
VTGVEEETGDQRPAAGTAQWDRLTGLPGLSGPQYLELDRSSACRLTAALGGWAPVNVLGRGISNLIIGHVFQLELSSTLRLWLIMPNSSLCLVL